MAVAHVGRYLYDMLTTMIIDVDHLICKGIGYPVEVRASNMAIWDGSLPAKPASSMPMIVLI